MHGHILQLSWESGLNKVAIPEGTEVQKQTGHVAEPFEVRVNDGHVKGRRLQECRFHQKAKADLNQFVTD